MDVGGPIGVVLRMEDREIDAIRNLTIVPPGLNEGIQILALVTDTAVEDRVIGHAAVVGLNHHIPDRGTVRAAAPNRLNVRRLKLPKKNHQIS